MKPILPPRPLALRPGFGRRARYKSLAAFGAALAIIGVLALWQGGAAYELIADQGAWERGVPVRVMHVDPSVMVHQGIARHVRITVFFIAANGEELAAEDDYWTLFTDAVGDTPLRARLGADTGRVALNWSMESAPWRWAWIVAVVVLFGFFAVILLGFGRQTLNELWTARSASRESEAIWLEVLSLESAPGADFHYLNLHYRAPPIESAETRESAVPGEGPARALTFGTDEAGPLVSSDGAWVFALRPRRDRHDVIIIREDFGPFVLSEEERAAARAELADERQGDDAVAEPCE